MGGGFVGPGAFFGTSLTRSTPPPNQRTKQSAKLSQYEARVVDLVARTRHLPQAMAERGEVAIGAREVARLIGQVCGGWGG